MASYQNKKGTGLQGDIWGFMSFALINTYLNLEMYRHFRHLFMIDT